jgi:hypothetical protein
MKELGADEILKIPATSRRKIFCLLCSYLKTQRLKYKGQKFSHVMWVWNLMSLIRNIG